MIEWMLNEVICSEFDKVVGKGQHESGKAMHLGFSMCYKNTDQYDVRHMYIFAPANYVYVAIQQERIDNKGKRHVGPMEILSYHDSCWTDAIQTFIFKNRDKLNGFSPFALFKWYDVVTLTERMWLP